MKICFSHGKESGPWGTKIEALASVARIKGFRVESPDYSKQPDPDARVEQLLSLHLPASDLTVLVGSSMGGYVATVASKILNPIGLFLMAPAFYLPGYKEQSPIPHARKTVIIHGLKDDVVPAENSIRFAREHNAELHLLDSDHRLNDQLPKIEVLFGLFLDEVMELSNVPKVLTWEKISQNFKHDEFRDYWVKQVWQQMIKAGHAGYRNEVEHEQVLLRFIALTDFYYDFLSAFSRDCWGDTPEDTAAGLDLRHESLDNLLMEYISRNGRAPGADPSLHDALEAVAREFVYPMILEYFGDFDGVAASIYQASYPTFYDEDTDEYLTDPEDLDVEEFSEMAAFKNIASWVEQKFTAPVESWIEAACADKGTATPEHCKRL